MFIIFGFVLSGLALTSNATELKHFDCSKLLMNGSFEIDGRGPGELKPTLTYIRNTRGAEPKTVTIETFENRKLRLNVLARKREFLLFEKNGDIFIFGKNGAFENHLLAESNVHHRPREVAISRLALSSGQYFTPDLRLLQRSEDMDRIGVDVTSPKLLLDQWSGEQALFVDSAHTHPVYEIESEDLDRFFPFDLNATDISAADTLAIFLPGHIVLERAILPNGYWFGIAIIRDKKTMKSENVSARVFDILTRAKYKNL